MEHKLQSPDSAGPDGRVLKQFTSFLQSMLNRLWVGGLRYGPPERRKRYMSRLLAETDAYKASGNREQLLNIAVYCFLESVAPEHKKFHDNANADSVTRKKFGV